MPSAKLLLAKMKPIEAWKCTVCADARSWWHRCGGQAKVQHVAFSCGLLLSHVPLIPRKTLAVNEIGIFQNTVSTIV